MAEQKKKQRNRVVSPAGVAKWVKVNKPDTKFNAEGDYSIDLLLDPNDADAQKFIARLEKAHEDGYLAAKKAEPKKQFVKMPLKIVDDVTKDKETGEETPTGMTRISFKCRASGKRKDGTIWTYRPGLYDAKEKALPADVLIYGGSVVKVAFEIKHTPMKTGSFYTSFSLEAVQVLNLKTAGAREASYYGFRSEEGYEADPSTTEPATEGTTESEKSDDSSDF